LIRVVEFIGQSVYSRYSRLCLHSRRQAFVEEILLCPPWIRSILFNKRLSEGTSICHERVFLFNTYIVRTNAHLFVNL